MSKSLPNRTIEEFKSDEEGTQESWTQHEHVAEPVSKEAQHLMRLAGSAELAKQAIDAVDSGENYIPSAAREELARDLGYQNVGQMMEQTEIVPLPTGSFVHLTTDSDGYWVAWTEKPFYDIQRFASRQQAISALQERAESISLQS
jgi:hypothetical protein